MNRQKETARSMRQLKNTVDHLRKAMEASRPQHLASDRLWKRLFRELGRES